MRYQVGNKISKNSSNSDGSLCGGEPDQSYIVLLVLLFLICMNQVSQVTEGQEEEVEGSSTDTIENTWNIENQNF